MPIPASSALPLTGERTAPGVPAENYWFRRHEIAYRWALPHLRDRSVLDVGCGEGYGTAMIARVAAQTLGVDYDASTVAHARARYPQARFVRGNLAALPVRTSGVDVVATLQVVEHVWDHSQFVGECRRVLCGDGRLLVTTPNRLTFSPGRDTPLNPFHTKEFTAAELAGLLTRCGFDVGFVAGLHAGPRLRELDRRHGGSFVEAQLASAPGSWTAQLSSDVASVRAADFEVRATDLDTALDLVILATAR